MYRLMYSGSQKLLAALSLLLFPAIVWADAEALLIRKSPQGVTVERFAIPPAADEDREGLLVWSTDGLTEEWHWWSPRDKWPLVAVSQSETLPGGNVRSVGSSVASLTQLQGTLRLAQLATGVAQRGKLGAFYTPGPGAICFSGTPTFRRASDDGKLPAAEGALLDETGRVLLKFFMAEGATQTPWRSISNRPAGLADRLPPGDYRLRLGDQPEVTVFRVADDEAREKALDSVIELSEAVQAGDEGVLDLFRIQVLLSLKTDKGQPKSLGDAIDAIDSAETSTPFLKALREQLDNQAKALALNTSATAETGVAPADDLTGIAEIDEARRLIASGLLTRAGQTLTAYQPSDSRGRGLQKLYEAVVHAEAGANRQAEAVAGFAAAAELLNGASDSDRMRVSINASGFLLRLVQDRLNNQTFRSATGAERPILLALENWIEADRSCGEAVERAVAVKSPLDLCTSRLNLARSRIILADAITMLSMTSGSPEQCESLARAAQSEAVEQLELVNADPSSEPWRGLTHEMRAVLAFRSGNASESTASIRTGIDAYVGQGSLPGVESLMRLAGLVALAEGDKALALKRFTASHVISEFLRDQFPADQLGVGRAGFFARRGYVYEQMIDLLVESGNAAEALYYVELAKARSAQDLLAMRGVSSKAANEAESPADLLERWPAGTCALEYFVGERQAYGFLVDSQGEVSCWVIADGGDPVDSQALIHGVKAFLSGIEGQSVKMRRQILTGKGLDRAWQDDLHRYYQLLVPEPVRPALASCRQVVIVPHHILHYFPFAALVTERDTKERGKLEMITPKFFVDEPFDVLYSPSLGVWDMLRAVAPPSRDARAIGIVEVPGAPPLPGVQHDLDNFREVFGERVKLMVEGDSTTTRKVQSVLGEPGILLIATHGMNEPDHPLDSYLLFIPEEQQGGGWVDGNLRARDILSTPVQASMVVMSACFSGLGDRTPPPGDDLFGLQRAFLMSGVRIVVSGLWDVYDGTAPELIRGYFERVRDGQPASRALAESQRAFLNRLRSSGKSELFLHPYFWAVYTAAGNDQSLP